MQQGVHAHEWRQYGLGGPPEPWHHDAQRDIDRLATSYYLDVMELRSQILDGKPGRGASGSKVEELHTTATRHKTEIDYTLRHWATPVERARVGRPARLADAHRPPPALPAHPARRPARHPDPAATRHRTARLRLRAVATLGACRAFPLLADILEARAAAARRSRCTRRSSDSPTLAAESGAAEVRLKLEMLQPTGSFKTRGAHNKVALVAAAQPDARLVTASSGNHGIAVATAAARHGMRPTVLVGASVSPAKLERLRALESDSCVVEIFGRDSDDAEAEARRRDTERDRGLRLALQRCGCDRRAGHRRRGGARGLARLRRHASCRSAAAG